MFQVEGLMDDIDFKSKVTRVEFEALCTDLFERVPHTVQDALSSAEMSLVSQLSILAVLPSYHLIKSEQVVTR